jgi:hypothetical protein
MTKHKSWRSQQCRWAADEDGNYDTACGEKFTFNDDGPVENGPKVQPHSQTHIHAHTPPSPDTRPAASQEERPR